MRLRLLLAALVAVSVGVSGAVAAPPPGKGKPQSTDLGCRPPRVAVVLEGTLLSTSSSPSGLYVNVTHSNRHGRAYTAATVQPVFVFVDQSTKFRRQGKKTFAALVGGDRVLVQARACKGDLEQGATPQLTALRVVAHPAE
jgi:hypothetical protein